MSADSEAKRAVGDGPANAIEEYERELADFFDSPSVGLHWSGADGTILRANMAELQLLGYSADEYIGQHVSEFHADQEVIARLLTRLRAEETLHDEEARLRCKDGSIRHVLIDSRPIRRDGKVIYNRTFTRDITASKQAERDRARLAAIIESSDDAIVSKDLDGFIQSWNSGAERIFGYTAAEAIGQKIMLIIPPDRYDEERQILTRLRKGQRIEHYETVRRAKSGKLIDISVTISPMKDQNGTVIGASKVARDITERKRADTALRLSEQRFSRFMQHLPGLAWVKDIQGRYVYVNDAALKPFQISREELYGKTDHDIFSASTAALFKENDDRALSSEAGVQVVESLQHGDGRLHHSIVSKFPIFDAEGKPAFIGGMAIDITDRIVVEEALREADRRKDAFLATLAHELRNPLAPIRNSLQILRMQSSTEQVEQLHEIMDRQIHQLVHLVDDLLELSRISSGKIELVKERVDLATIIQNAIETSKPWIESGGHQLSVLLPEERIFVFGDAVRLAQVFSNLLNNAAKYTDNGGKIALQVRNDGGDVIITVRDSGVGIPREMLAQVFDMFAQVDRKLRRSQEGLGIGLNLVRTLITMHGGIVEAHSDGLGHGSEFMVRLPRAADTTAFVTAVEENSAIQFAPTRRVLIVDDNHDSADSLGMLLKFLGAEVRVVYDGPSTIEAVRDFQPSAILLDIGMPAMDGYDVARHLRSDPVNKDLTLIALTGWGQEADRNRSIEAGFDHHLVKPVDIAQLDALLSKADSHRRFHEAAKAVGT